MTVLKPLILLCSAMPTCTIKSINGTARFNLITITSIVLLIMFLSISAVYSSPPPLPNTKNINQNDKTTIDDTDALLNGINQFMDSRESDTENTIKPHGNSTNQADSFIDFSNDKLPLLEGDKPDTKPNIETPDLPTNLPKQQESTPTNIVDTQETQPTKTPNVAVPSTKLPPLPTSSPGNIAPPEVKAPDNVVVPEIKVPDDIPPEVKIPDNISTPKIQEQNSVKDDGLLPTKESTINKELIDEDEIAIPTLDIPFQENTKPPFTPIVPDVNITKPEVSTPVDVGGTETKAPIGTILPNILDTNQTKQTKEDQLKPATSTPIPVFVQEQAPVEPIKQDTTSKKPDENKSAQEEKITPNKLQEKISIPKKAPLVTVKNNPARASTIQSPEVMNFAKDETQMLLLPNDDIVLGVLTDEARLEQMDMYTFIKIAKQSYDRKNQAKKRRLIENFINSYSLQTIKPIASENLIDTAFESVKKNNLFVLRTLVDNYQVLNYTLLHEAAESGNYYMAKFLIIRGININAVDYQHRTALDIAESENNNVSCIIRKAIGR